MACYGTFSSAMVLREIVRQFGAIEFVIQDIRKCLNGINEHPGSPSPFVASSLSNKPSLNPI